MINDRVDALFKITGIYNADTLRPRRDAKSLARKGSIVQIAMLCEGLSCWMPYVKDNRGKPKDGTLATSNVQSYTVGNSIRIVTLNSVYCLEAVDGDE